MDQWQSSLKALDLCQAGSRRDSGITDNKYGGGHCKKSPCVFARTSRQ
jgi:hypothetical protein